ncbi:hypothetical protein Acr_07g0017160 [Actinidia rufa]|uniref:Uncharacterized protein n=1 Tax=Actinidia rufa TaxID=165716 RepID=A0A7J0EYN2_9ERIC|nr:hypothetical protein Acr_07g0017160 [Actinidia rufa]
MLKAMTGSMNCCSLSKMPHQLLENAEQKAVVCDETQNGTTGRKWPRAARRPQILGVIAIKEEHESVNGYRSDSNVYSCLQNKKSAGIFGNPIKAFVLHNSCEDKGNLKKMKVSWLLSLLYDT